MLARHAALLASLLALNPWMGSSHLVVARLTNCETQAEVQRAEFGSHLMGLCIEMCKTVKLYPSCPQCRQLGAGGSDGLTEPGKTPEGPPTEQATWDVLIEHLDNLGSWGRSMTRHWERQMQGKSFLQKVEANASCEVKDRWHRELVQGKLASLCEIICQSGPLCRQCVQAAPQGQLQWKSLLGEVDHIASMTSSMLQVKSLHSF
mmetsp:Transcript_77976/g.137428  ORF Transcript_77976/g.137428 Transcript_77976/m.137428 type:complete len:205 (-) Transcript_77976:64-678(-)